MKKSTVIALAAAAGVGAALTAAVLLVADKTYRVTCLQTKKQKKRNSDPHIELGHEQYADISPKMHELINEEEATECEKVEITSSADGITLRGRYYEFNAGAPLIIFFHGYRGTALRDGCGGFKLARDSGRNILMVDQRANSESDGKVITFGIKERIDCRDWAEYAVRRFGDDIKIILTGVSLGAATVLMASDAGLPENVKCIIADCGYSSPKEIICKVASEGGYPAKLCYPLLKASCKIRAGFDLDSSSALESVSHTNIPILIIHGDDDRYVPCEMAYRIYEACASPKKELLIIPGAPHAAAYMVDEKTYTDTANRFISECLA